MEPRKAAETRLKANMLEAQVVAALGGHELQGWETLDTGALRYQATCAACGQRIFASSQALYSLLDDQCPILTDRLDLEESL